MLKKFWNSQWFGWAAVWFGRVSNYACIVFGILLLLWGISGAGGGIMFLGLASTVSGVFAVQSVKRRRRDRMYTKCPGCQKEVKIGLKFCPTCGAAIPVQEIEQDTLEAAGKEASADDSGDTLTKKKIGLLATILVLVLVIWAVSAFGGPAGKVKSLVLDDYGPQTMEQLVDENFSSPQWSVEKLDNSSGYVCAEGFCPTYGERARLKFYYDEDYAQLVEIALLDSMESYTDTLNISIGLGMLYE